LNTGIALIFALLAFVSIARINFIRSDQPEISKRIKNSILQIPKGYWFYLLPVCIFSLYSLFIGQFNLNNTSISLSDLYSRLPEGIYYQFTQKPGFPILFLTLALNTIILTRSHKTVEGKKILTIFKWIGLFAVLYILLLPLGGYRDYRPNVLRYDTIMPITFSLFFMFGISTLHLLKTMTGKQKTWYIPIIAGILFIFTIADKADFDQNKCERMALKEISGSKNETVELDCDCSVLSWDKIVKPEDSELNSQLLTIWRITKDKKLYFSR
jgi:hypothetical protein